MSGWTSFTRDLLEQMPLILAGLLKTVQLAGLISISGLLLGIVVFYLTLSKSHIVRNTTNAYISFFIGMPLIVLLFLMYYGLPSWGVRLSPFTVAFIGFTFNVAAYNAAYLKTAFNGLDKSQLEAARAQGFNPLQIFRYITLPQVMRLSIPALTHQLIANLTDSTIAF
jgi:polar amino acid transport system permease protein